MHVYVPYVAGMLCPQVEPALIAAGADYEPWPIEACDRAGYSEAFCWWWAQGEGFAIVEQDIVVRPDVFAT